MKPILRRLKTTLVQQKAGLFAFALSALATAAFIIYPKGGHSTPVPSAGAEPEIKISNSKNGVVVSGSLAQTKLIEHGSNQVFLKVELKTPPEENSGSNTGFSASDFVVVLDRSGSMNSSDKLPYAKAAIQDLINTLGAEDRFAFVTFDNHAVVETPLTPVNDSKRDWLASAVNRIRPGGGTNIEAGIFQAQHILAREDSSRLRKIILLSDGEANVGTTSPEGLARLVDRAAAENTVLSTIGLGIGFNQNLMSLLADHGMGNYAYLEHLDGLGAVLASTVKEARETFAARSEVALNLPDGVRIIDAGGYPVRQEGSLSLIQSGQLRENSSKSFFVTLAVPTNKVREFDLGSLGLNYWKSGERYSVAPSKEHLQLAVLPQSMRRHAIDSIQRSVYEENWRSNAFGIVKRKVANLLTQGNQAAAEEELTRYKSALDKASAQSGIALYDKKVKSELAEMRSTLIDAFRGDARAQSYKQNIAGKKYQLDSLESQRKQR